MFAGTRFDLLPNVTTLIFLTVIGAVAYRATTPEIRRRAVRATVSMMRWLKEYGHEELEPFRSALRSRTPVAIVTSALVIVNISIFLWMRSGGRPTGESATLIGWGASFGPRTTNGEWWRLATAMFVHATLMSVLLNTAALLQVGLMLERLVGPLTFLTTYIAAGVFASLTSVSTQPLGVSAGASGAMLGVYGLLLASLVSSRWRGSEVTIPPAAVIRLLPLTAMFVLYTGVVSPFGAAAEAVALVSGMSFGAVAAKDFGQQPPPPRRIAVAAATALAIVAVSAFPLRGISDVRPEIERLVAVEQSTVGSYDKGAHQFRNRIITANALADLIESAIVPALQAADARVAALAHVPREDEQRLADARLYLRLRCESWRLRAQELRATSKAASAASKSVNEADTTQRARAEARYRSTMLLRGKAEAAERAALEALNRIAL